MKKHFDSKYLLVGAAVAAVGFLLVFFLLTRPNNVSLQDDSPIDQPEQAAANEGVRRLSDGKYIAEEDQISRYYGVMIENSADAWPLSGVSEARMVIEAPVEGFIPRFLVIFDDKQEVKQIGPVRSARPYYVEWAHGINALYAHVGGSPEGLSLIDRLGLKDLNEFWFGQFFWRDRSRYAPHNVYTSIEELGNGYAYRAYEEEQPEALFTYKEDKPSEDREQQFSVELLKGASNYRAGWVYDSEKNSYLRHQGGKQQKDRDNEEVFAKNVLILFTEMSVIDEVGRLRLRTKGEGEGKAFFDGTEQEIIWEKESDDAWIKFFVKETRDPLFMNAGTTWIEVVPTGSEVFTSL